MKASWFFVLRELRRRPRDFLSLIGITTAVLVTIVLFLLFSESRWRQTVFPESPDNYHFYVMGLTKEEANTLLSWEEVMSVYTTEQSVTRVRVQQRYAGKAAGIFVRVLDTFDLWHTSYYNGWRRDLIGIELNAYFNVPYFLASATPYLAYPSTVLLLAVFALFLGAGVTLLTKERFLRNLPDDGTLLALGMRPRHFYAIYGMEAAAVCVLSLPFSFLLTAAATAILKPILRGGTGAERAVFDSLADVIPVGAILLAFLFFTIASVLGACLVCYRYQSLTLMERLDGGRAPEIAFVEETSKRFEKARSVRIYSRLRALRTRSNVLINSIEVAVMLPLPTFFWYQYAGELTTEEGVLTKRFLLFLALTLSLTAAVVAVLVSSYHLRARKKEFAVLRALGASGRDVLSIAIPACLIDAVMSAVSGSVVSACLVHAILTAESDIILSNHLIGKPLFEWLSFVLFFAAASSLFTAPTEMGGLGLSLPRILTRDISDNLREVE